MVQAFELVSSKMSNFFLWLILVQFKCSTQMGHHMEIVGTVIHRRYFENSLLPFTRMQAEQVGILSQYYEQ